MPTIVGILSTWNGSDSCPTLLFLVGIRR